VNKLSLLNNTPVDLVYKYIDLSDPALNRTDSVRKDFDNNELQYSIRSALKNIPWIRYIYIIMPNERVSFLKSADLISSKKPHFSLDKKSSTLERTKEKQDKYNEKRSKTLCVNFMFGALASFPQGAKRPFS